MTRELGTAKTSFHEYGRVRGCFDQRLYQQVLGAANAFKEGDASLGIAAADDFSRAQARALLSRTKLGAIHSNPPFEDRLHAFMLESLDGELMPGNEAANRTFDVTIEKMVLYFETGQGADATNGHHHGCDMLIHESRKYGFARALKARVALAQLGAGRAPQPWVHVNDVAGFIGPEVFRTREQLVRCCLEEASGF